MGLVSLRGDPQMTIIYRAVAHADDCFHRHPSDGLVP